MTTAQLACQNIKDSVAGAAEKPAEVTCDNQYAYVGGDALSVDPMMNGITATNLQVPIQQNLTGSNAWKIPLIPTVNTGTKVAAVDGPIGVAINGIPIFNPCKQGGCSNGDTKVLGELDICNGHAGRADDYHYHAAPTCMMAHQTAHYWDTHPVGWALDGYAILGYNDSNGTTASRDGICGGNTSSQNGALIPSGYSYHVTDNSPYVLSCFYGIPSPDLAGQGAKFKPIRQPPVTPFKVSAMTLTTDPTDGYQVLQFTAAITFTTNETGTDSYNNPPGTYKIRSKQLTGSALTAALASNSGKTQCWQFQFQTVNGTQTQPPITYCR